MAGNALTSESEVICPESYGQPPLYQISIKKEPGRTIKLVVPLEPRGPNISSKRALLHPDAERRT